MVLIFCERHGTKRYDCRFRGNSELYLNFFFSFPQAPNYSSVIKDHIDFSMISSQLNSGAYKSNGEFVGDVFRVISNSELYWSRDTKQYAAGKRLSKAFNLILKESSTTFIHK